MCVCLFTAFSILKDVLNSHIASFMSFDYTVPFGMMVAYVFGIYWNGPFHKYCDLLHLCVAIVICLVRFILKTSNDNRGHYKNECTPLLKHAVSAIMLTTNVPNELSNASNLIIGMIWHLLNVIQIWFRFVFLKILLYLGKILCIFISFTKCRLPKRLKWTIVSYLVAAASRHQNGATVYKSDSVTVLQRIQLWGIDN